MAVLAAASVSKMRVEVVKTRFSFSHLKLTTDEGKNIWLYNVDDAQKISEAIKNKRYR
jgi:hypothetical protein